MSTVKHLDRSMARAVAWNAGAQWATQILSWASAVVIARLLTPYDYGLVGMAGVYLGLATLISKVGISNAIVALRDLSHRQIAELNTVAVFIGAALVGVSCLLALPIANFFSSPPLKAVVMVMSATYILSSCQVVPRALLQREFRFKLLSLIEMVSALSQMIVALVLAWCHFRYWSLVAGMVASSLVATISLMSCRWHPFAVPTLARLHREMRFGRHTLTGGIAWYVYDNADFAVAGRVLGGAALGNYTIAWTIASAPVEKIANLVSGVTPAFFSAVQNSHIQLRRYFLQISEVLSLVTIPASVGIVLTADRLIPVILGPKWEGAVGPIRFLGLFFAVRSLGEVPSKLLNAIGDTRFVMWMTIAFATVLPVSFWIGSRWGANGIAGAWVVAYPPLLVPMYWRAFQKTGTRVREYLFAVTPALAASLIMAGAVLLIRVYVDKGSHAIAGFLLLLSIGVLSYLGGLYALFPTRVKRVVSAFRHFRRGAGEGPVPQSLELVG